MLKALVLLFCFVLVFANACATTSIQAVGPALQFTPTTRVAQPLDAGKLMVISWNVHVGHGRIPELLDTLTKQEQARGFKTPEFVLLLQEAFRRGPEVPDPGGTRAPGRISPPETGSDIEDVARDLGWWLYYAPSMRNGSGLGQKGEDRGNAILSSLPLEEMEAVELPFVVQRRVAIAATVTDPRRGLRFRVAVAHLDTRAPLKNGWILGGPPARNRQAAAIVQMLAGGSSSGSTVVLGGDLNTHLGPDESAVRTLAQFAPRVDCGDLATHTSGLALDHVFVRTARDLPAPRCRQATETFGSDHFPLVLAFDESASSVGNSDSAWPHFRVLRRIVGGHRPPLQPGTIRKLAVPAQPAFRPPQ